LKYSRQRELILKTLKENVVHPTADFIYNVLKKQVPNLSLATVYRNLHLLADNGLIKRIDGLDGSIHFDHNIDEHYHFICAKCGKVYDIPYEVAPQLADTASSLTGLDVREYDISFKGYCPECKTKL
jgi:Fur family peroxide stress response transcriptional regulator